MEDPEVRTPQIFFWLHTGSTLKYKSQEYVYDNGTF